MDARGTKRKHIEIVKNELGTDCIKLNYDSEKLNEDMKASREDFGLMCKSMNDRLSEILTQGMFLEEQHRRVLDVLDGRHHGQDSESTGGNETLAMPTIEDVKKLARDSDETLRNHRIMREIEIQEMEKVFKEYKAIMKQNIVGLRERAECIEKQRRELSPKLIQFARAVAEESG